MRAKFPFFEVFRDTFVRNIPPDSLLKMETTTIKMRESKRSRNTNDRLAANRAALSTASKTVIAGSDNRWASLHEDLFLPGVCCSVAKLG
jgi:hypothetical protein